MVTTNKPSVKISPFFQRLGRWGAAHPALYYLAPLAGWVILVSWGSLAPPNDLPEIRIPQFDKLEHFTCYGVLAALMLRGWVRQGAVTLGAGLLVELVAGGWGLYLEFLQRMTGYRTFDLWDAASNALGAALGLAVWTMLASRQRRAATPALSAEESPLGE